MTQTFVKKKYFKLTKKTCQSEKYDKPEVSYNIDDKKQFDSKIRIGIISTSSISHSVREDGRYAVI